MTSSCETVSGSNCSRSDSKVQSLREAPLYKMSYKDREIILVPFVEFPYKGYILDSLPPTDARQRQEDFSIPINKKKKGMATDIWYPALTILTTICVLAQFTVEGLARQSPYGDMFLNDLDYNRLYKYVTSVTPAQWTYNTMWIAIYAWQTLWIIFALVNMCREAPKGSASVSPAYLPPALFGLIMVTCACRIASLMLFEKSQMTAFTTIMVTYAILVAICLAVSYRALNKCCAQLVKESRTKEIWIVRLLVHNGLGLQAGWVTMEAVTSIAVSMMYAHGSNHNAEVSGSVALGFLAGISIVFAVADMALLDSHSRYTITPYISFVTGFVGIIHENYKEVVANSIFAIALVCVTGAFLFIKIWVSLYRHSTRPANGGFVLREDIKTYNRSPDRNPVIVEDVDCYIP